MPMSLTNTSPSTHSRQQVIDFLKDYQDKLTGAIMGLDQSAVLQEDAWKKSGLGQGRTRVITGDGLIEQAGVNFSHIEGKQAPASLLGHKPELRGHAFSGAGVSLIIHPRNPFCPTVHLNYRYFEAGPIWWFAGGCDLTPYYPFMEDCHHWHLTLKRTLDSHHPDAYTAFKYWCDEYFFNHHRQETRGVGGIFYDYQDGQPGLLIKPDHGRRSEDPAAQELNLTQAEKSWEQMFAFQQANANAFFEAYWPIIERRKSHQWTEAQREFQLYRRGRYVEFNLLYDRGTLFGLQSNGRVESILMSLPPLVRWQYNFTPESGSVEADLTDHYLQRHKDWLA